MAEAEKKHRKSQKHLFYNFKTNNKYTENTKYESIDELSKEMSKRTGLLKIQLFCMHANMKHNAIKKFLDTLHNETIKTITTAKIISSTLHNKKIINSTYSHEYEDSINSLLINDLKYLVFYYALARIMEFADSFVVNTVRHIKERGAKIESIDERTETPMTKHYSANIFSRLQNLAEYFAEKIPVTDKLEDIKDSLKDIKHKVANEKKFIEIIEGEENLAQISNHITTYIMISTKIEQSTLAKFYKDEFSKYEEFIKNQEKSAQEFDPNPGNLTDIETALFSSMAIDETINKSFKKAKTSRQIDLMTNYQKKLQSAEIYQLPSLEKEVNSAYYKIKHPILGKLKLIISHHHKNGIVF